MFWLLIVFFAFVFNPENPKILKILIQTNRLTHAPLSTNTKRASLLKFFDKGKSVKKAKGN